MLLFKLLPKRRLHNKQTHSILLLLEWDSLVPFMTLEYVFTCVHTSSSVIFIIVHSYFVFILKKKRKTKISKIRKLFPQYYRTFFEVRIMDELKRNQEELRNEMNQLKEQLAKVLETLQSMEKSQNTTEDPLMQINNC